MSRRQPLQCTYLGAIALLAILSGACASTGGTPRPFPMGGAGSAGHHEPRTARDANGGALVDAALRFRGVPYRNGGSDPKGFDCSGLTQYVFAQFGLRLPREVRDQFKVGKSVKRREIEPGDLIFFTTTSRGASHVAIAIDDDRFVHAPSSKGVVRVERLSSTYWSRRIVGIRRVRAD